MPTGTKTKKICEPLDKRYKQCRVYPAPDTPPCRGGFTSLAAVQYRHLFTKQSSFLIVLNRCSGYFAAPTSSTSGRGVLTQLATSTVYVHFPFLACALATTPTSVPRIMYHVSRITCLVISYLVLRTTYLTPRTLSVVWRTPHDTQGKSFTVCSRVSRTVSKTAVAVGSLLRHSGEAAE
jgi:hypothetical protein